VTDYNVDPIVWFADRQLEYPPAHFITATTLLTAQSRQWVLNSLRGRFSITDSNDFLFDNSAIGRISFEDPREATMYELKWS
jgi:hypothetical protein